MRHTTFSMAAIGNCQIIRRLSGALLALLLAASAQGQIVINEIMADNNAALADEDGSFPDWIEIYNAGAADVDLNGWSLGSTNLARIPNPSQWSFPSTN